MACTLIEGWSIVDMLLGCKLSSYGCWCWVSEVSCAEAVGLGVCKICRVRYTEFADCEDPLMIRYFGLARELHYGEESIAKWYECEISLLAVEVALRGIFTKSLAIPLSNLMKGDKLLMQTHVVQLTKQRLSDFFVKEDGHVAHKNTLVAGTIATGAIFASLLLIPNTAEADICGEWPHNFFEYDPDEEYCCSGFHHNGDVFYYAADKEDGC